MKGQANHQPFDVDPTSGDVESTTKCFTLCFTWGKSIAKENIEQRRGCIILQVYDDSKASQVEQTSVV